MIVLSNKKQQNFPSKNKKGDLLISVNKSPQVISYNELT